jgi:tetratricopeptide (TPR) repeat protein
MAVADREEWQALGLFFRGDLAPAMGWVARGGRLLEGRRRDSVAQAWLLMLTALPRLFEGDPDAGPSFVEAGAIAERLADADASMFARLGRGYSLILQGRVAEGMALLDEVMVSVTAGEVAPMLAGVAYCQVIDLCQAVFDLRRAREWTEALTRWCDAQPGMVPFRGNCLVHRCEIFQLQGAWTDALESARRACEWLAGPPVWDALGSAYYQLGEVQRLRGELAEAQESYRRASLAGRDPEPGMSLLRLARGRVDLAVPAIRRALEEAADPIAKSRLLPAFVDVLLEAEDVGAARAAADELAGIAAQLDAPYLNALAAHASGAVASDPRCKRATGVGSSGSYQLTREDPPPWLYEYRPPRPSAPRSRSCSSLAGAAERRRAPGPPVGAADVSERHRSDRLRGAWPRPLPAAQPGLAPGLPQRLAAAPHPEDLAGADPAAAPQAAPRPRRPV